MNGEQPTPETEQQAPRERTRRFAPLLYAVMVMGVTLLPYLYGYGTSEGRRYLWLGYNFDDASVYLSWMRQTASPSLRVFNLFTTDAQTGLIANPLFVLLGLVHLLTKVPLLGVFHLARFVFGITLLLSVWNLLKSVLKTGSHRWIGISLVALSAGLGWLPLWNESGFDAPIDRWQPEAITFLSLYLNPLFTASMTLQVLVLGNLYRAEQAGESRFALKAGIASCLLSIIHGYDTISIAVVWLLYLLYKAIRKEATATLWKQAGIVAGITLPGVLFMLYQFKSESVFRERIAVATLSAPLHWVALGYGIPLVLAVVTLLKNRKEQSSPAVAFLGIWMIGNLLASYIPVSFQRKMLQGTHIPIAILASFFIANLLEGKTWRANIAWRVAIRVLFLLTNLFFVYRDIQNTNSNITQTQLQRPYLKQGEQLALDWITQNAPVGSAIQPLPHLKFVKEASTGRTQTAISDTTLATIAPWVTGHAVYCGHFGETPQYQDRLNALNRFLTPNTPEAEKKNLLEKMHVKYLIFSQTSQSDMDADTFAPIFRHRLPLPPYLKQVFTNSDAEIYEVTL